MHELDPEIRNLPSLMSPRKTCIRCASTLRIDVFRRDSSFRDGHKDTCQFCEDSPRLSTEEHIIDRRERNYRSAQGQRWAHQEDFYDDRPRWGRPRHAGEIVRFLQSSVRGLLITQGAFKDDLSVFRTFGQAQADGKDYEYLGYITKGYRPEQDLVDFDHRDVPIRRREQGWRTPLLQFIERRLLTEEQVEAKFGPALGPSNVVWRRRMWELRNGKTAE
jgi:hypothetical protein